MTTFVPVEPQTLKWARESIGYADIEEVADKVGVAADEIVAWETGDKPVPLSKARKLAGTYKVALHFLYLRNVPEELKRDLPADFRRKETRKPYSHRLCLAVRTAQERQLWMRNYLIQEEKGKLDWPGKYGRTGSPDRIARETVDWLGID